MNPRASTSNPSAVPSSSTHPSDHTVSSKKPIIRTHKIQGDSLTSEADDRKVFGIPFTNIAGLKNISPDGSFTNGMTWVGHFLGILFSEFEKRYLEAKQAHKDQNRFRSDCDIADSLITNENHIATELDHFFDLLKSGRETAYRDQVVAEVFAEGGVTAHHWGFTWNPKLLGSREMLESLGDKRNELLRYDHDHAVTQAQKDETLIYEWTGANDILTVNKFPTPEEAKIAIQERKKNAEILIQNGYKKFVLFNLPDISLLPRYQEQDEAAQAQASTASACLNQELERAVAELREEHPDCLFEIFDVKSHFDEIYFNPEKYGFDPKKMKKWYVGSPEFIMDKENHTSPATGWAFWNNVHPTTDFHYLLALELFKFVMSKFKLLEPKPMQLAKDSQAIHTRRRSFDGGSTASLLSELGDVKVKRTHHDKDASTLPPASVLPAVPISSSSPVTPSTVKPDSSSGNADDSHSQQSVDSVPVSGSSIGQSTTKMGGSSTNIFTPIPEKKADPHSGEEKKNQGWRHCCSYL